MFYLMNLFSYHNIIPMANMSTDFLFELAEKLSLFLPQLYHLEDPVCLRIGHVYAMDKSMAVLNALYKWFRHPSSLGE